MTADAIVKAAMDYDMRNVERKGNGEELHDFLTKFRGALARMFNGASEDDKEYRENLEALQAIVSDIVERTRAGEIGGPLSFVTGMLESKSSTNGQFIQMQNFWSQCINVMIAGHETTAATLGFCMAELSRNPACLKKAMKEIEDVLGSRSSPTYEDISKLEYVEACFKETLRMYPPLPFLSRECATDTVVQGKYLLRKGQRVETFNIGLQRDSEQWDQGVFGSPDVFNPERHMPGAPERHPNAMQPFGFGVSVTKAILLVVRFFDLGYILTLLLRPLNLGSSMYWIPVCGVGVENVSGHDFELLFA